MIFLQRPAKEDVSSSTQLHMRCSQNRGLAIQALSGSGLHFGLDQLFVAIVIWTMHGIFIRRRVRPPDTTINAANERTGAAIRGAVRVVPRAVIVRRAAHAACGRPV